MTAGTEDPLAFVVDGLHDLAERLEQTGILGRVQVGIHADDDGERLADALSLTDRRDFKRGEYGTERAFTAWKGEYDTVEITVYGTTPGIEGV